MLYEVVVNEIYCAPGNEDQEEQREERGEVLRAVLVGDHAAAVPTMNVGSIIRRRIRNDMCTRTNVASPVMRFSIPP